MHRRVVVTGLGMVTPLGCGVESTWNNIKIGRSGIVEIVDFDVADIKCRVAGRIPRGDGSHGTYNPDSWMNEVQRRRVDEFVVFALAAAGQALTDADWRPTSDVDLESTGVMIGSGIGGIGSIYDSAAILQKEGARRVSPHFIPSSLINMASGHIAIRYGFRGPNHSIVTACASGTHAIGDAARMIVMGDADVMVAGGAENAVNRIALAGFASCRALATKYNDSPSIASRPFDKSRDGFIMGEGSGVVVLEELEHAHRRGAKIYAEVIGYGMSGDAYHITAPSENGDGAYRSMRNALRNAGLQPSDIDYINAHGTATKADSIECFAVSRLLADSDKRVMMSSTKSMTGHLLGAAGAIEFIFAVLAIQDQIAPPTINLDIIDDDCLHESIDLVPHYSKEANINIVLSNSFGFGGTNASIIVRKTKT